jgi:hypothetical protein
MPVVERVDDVVSVVDEFGEQLANIGVEHEFILVFDGPYLPPSSLLERSRRDPSLCLLRFDQTFGEAAALRAGIDKSANDIIVTLPAYFQVRSDGLRRVLAALWAGADLVVTRRSPRVDGWFNLVQSRAFNSLVKWVSGMPFSDMACGLRAMRRPVAYSIPLYGDLHRFIPALAAREGFVVEEVPVAQHALDTHRRIYHPGTYMRRALDILTFLFLAKFTDKPLRFFGLIGMGLLGTGAVLSVALIVQRWMGTGIANRPLLLLAVLLLALGVQVIGLGLVGEIIVYLRAPNRRTYRVRDTASFQAAFPVQSGQQEDETGRVESM